MVILVGSWHGSLDVWYHHSAHQFLEEQVQHHAEVMARMSGLETAKVYSVAEQVVQNYAEGRRNLFGRNNSPFQAGLRTRHCAAVSRPALCKTNLFDRRAEIGFAKSTRVLLLLPLCAHTCVLTFSLEVRKLFCCTDAFGRTRSAVQRALQHGDSQVVADARPVNW